MHDDPTPVYGRLRSDVPIEQEKYEHPDGSTMNPVLIPAKRREADDFADPPQEIAFARNSVAGLSGLDKARFDINGQARWQTD